MSSQIIAVSSDIIKTRDVLVQKNEEYQASYKKIYEILESVSQSGIWGGADTNQYRENILEFRNDFDDLHLKLEQYCSFLAKTADAYSVTQDVVTKRASKLASDR